MFSAESNRQTDRYDVYNHFCWHIPDKLNIAELCCARWAAGESRIAIFYEDGFPMPDRAWGEIEDCLVKHATAANAAVVPKADPERGNVVKAFIALLPAATCAKEADEKLITELQMHVRGKLVGRMNTRRKSSLSMNCR